MNTRAGYVSRVLASVARILLGLGVAYLVLLVLAWRFQNRMALPGARGPLVTPEQARIPDGQIVEVTTPDGEHLRGWYLPPNPRPLTGGAPGLLWYYGNMESVSGLAFLLRGFRPPGVALLILDYPGYGESSGSPSEQGLYATADAGWAYLASRPELDSTRIAVYGRSVGSVPALYAATSHPVRAVVLESPLTTAWDMARVHYPFLPRFILRLSLNNLERAGRLTAPLLVVHGDGDQIAPPWMGRAVAEAGHAREFVIIKGAGHNETYDVGGRDYREKVLAFLTETLQ